MFDLVERKVVKLGKYEDGVGWDGKAIGHYYQWLTLSCGHKCKAMVDLAAWRVGSTCYCPECEIIKKELRAEMREEIRHKLEKIF